MNITTTHHSGEEKHTIFGMVLFGSMFTTEDGFCIIQKIDRNGSRFVQSGTCMWYNGAAGDRINLREALLQSRLVLRILSIALIVLGIGLLAVVAVLYVDADYERASIMSQFTPPKLESASLPTVEPLPTLEAEKETPSVTSRGIVEPTPSPKAEPSPLPSTPTPQTAPARWIRIPRIGVDSPVVEAKIENGEWQVPKFVAGHLESTADPGEAGNVALAGHIQSIASGNVFARIGELRAGDKIFIYAGRTLFPYRVRANFVVKNDDLSVLQPTSSPTLTLITCTGTWNLSAMDYNERLIVVADLVNLRNLN